MNGVTVLDMGHSDVVTLIQALPVDFRLVVARRLDHHEEHVVTPVNLAPVENAPDAYPEEIG